MGQTSTSLSGARVWLSGAIPTQAKDAERKAITHFISLLARQVFSGGGHIVHGSHPTVTPTLLSEARAHQEQGGKKDCLILAVSRHWSKDSAAVPVADWRNVALVYETPEAGGASAREDSLEILRKWMASRSDALVVVGGKGWAGSPAAGVPKELLLAIERRLPIFLAAGLGGDAQSYFQKNPEILGDLKNGWSDDENRAFAGEENVDGLVDRTLYQLMRLPLVRGRGADGVSFRILALDGGGIKGAFTAAALAAWEHDTGLKVVDHFDLIAGTSTGGILAIGLGLGLTAQQMVEFYRERGPVIFPVMRLRGRLWRTLRHVLLPKFSQTVLLNEINKAYFPSGGVIRLKDSKCRLVIPSYHAVSGASHIFRTPHHPNLTRDGNTSAAHAALATAAAPTYFCAAKIADMIAESSYLDGGVWANSPAMVAIIEAVCFLGVPLDRLDVLSVGTTAEPFTARLETRKGIIGWNRKLLFLLMNVQQEASLRSARELVTDPRFLRVNFLAKPGAYKLDGAREIGELLDLGQQKAREFETLTQVKSRFLNGVTVTPWEKFGS